MRDALRRNRTVVNGAVMKRLTKERSGQAAVQFVLMATVTTAVILAGFAIFSESIQGLFGQVSTELADSRATINDGESLPSNATTGTSRGSTDNPFLLFVLFCVCAIFIAKILNLNLVRSHARSATKPECEITSFVEQSKSLSNVLRKRNTIQNLLRDDWLQLFEGNVTVETYMTTQLKTVHPSATIEEVHTLIHDHGMRHVPVTQNKKLVGVISSKDLARTNASLAGEVMTSEPVTVKDTSNLSLAITILLQNRFSSLPVVDESGALVGILTSTDLMMVLQCILVVLTGITDPSYDRLQQLESLEKRLRECVEDQPSNGVG